MKLVVANVLLKDKMEHPEQKLDAGEAIVTRIVEMDRLNEVLKEYDQKGFVVDARLSHFASGYEIAQRLAKGSK